VPLNQIPDTVFLAVIERIAYVLTCTCNLIKEIILKKKYDVPNCLYELEERKKKFKIYDKIV